jgi:hypothetical protein
MLEDFFDSRGTLHYEFIPKGKTVNKDMYIKILHHLRDVVRRKCPKKWRAKVAVSFTTMLQHTSQFWLRIS